MLPALYHAHHSMNNEDIPFWLNLARESQGAILELGVGTGRIYDPLLITGKMVIGLDNDIQMLKYLLNNLPTELKRKRMVFQGDLTAFHLASRFGLILLACNTYSTLTPNQRKTTLRCVVDHLQPGGVFAVSLPNGEFLKSLPRYGEAEIEEIFPHPLDHEPVQVSSGWILTEEQFTLFWHYDHLLPDGGVDRKSVKVVHQLTETKEFYAEFRAAGFKDVLTFGDFDRSELISSSPMVIFLASL